MKGPAKAYAFTSDRGHSVAIQVVENGTVEIAINGAALTRHDQAEIASRVAKLQAGTFEANRASVVARCAKAR
jgi:regulation of enolase protein 1 (concanavalin A-like superfamily)